MEPVATPLAASKPQGRSDSLGDNGRKLDEVLFAAPLYRIDAALYHLRILKHDVPLMTMSYVGALKSWIYIPIFGALGVNVWTIRVPMLAAGAASIWLFYVFMRRIAGERAAIAG